MTSRENDLYMISIYLGGQFEEHSYVFATKRYKDLTLVIWLVDISTGHKLFALVHAVYISKLYIFINPV